MSELTPKKKGIFREYGEALLVALAVAAFIRLFLVSVFTIPSGSMLETIQIGDYILVNKLSYGLKLPFSGTWIYKAEGPQYGDIIVFKYPKNPSVDYIKRVVGLPGDIIEMRDKQFYRNGEKVVEDYIIQTRPHYYGPLDNMPPFKVPADEYFCMGDNRDNSEDSRSWGTVSRDEIYGKAWRIYWSWDSKNNSLRFSRLGKKLE